MPRHLPLSLFLMRISTAAFLLVWALAKLIAPHLSTRVTTNFYGFTPDALLVTLVGIAQVLFVLAFALGLFKLVTYGGMLIFHTISMAVSWQQLITPYTSPHLLFWSGIPVIALLLALFLLRDADTMGTLKFPGRKRPAEALSS